MITKQGRYKYSIAIKLIPVIAIVLALKFAVHAFHLEVLEINALFTSIVAGTVFLLGFVISGVLADYKEAEKIPGELAASLEALHDDISTVAGAKNSLAAKRFAEYYREYASNIHAWLYGEIHAQELLHSVTGINNYLIELEGEGVQPNVLIKMKSEQSLQRKLIIRIHTIRDTSFVPSAYAIVEILAVTIALWMVLMHITPFYQSLFFTAIVSFLFGYMIFLIHDLDNPFEYARKGERGTEISLKPLYDLQKKLG